MRKFEDFTGRRYGKLVVVEHVKTPKRHKWKCKCDCGNTVVVNGSDLKSGDTRSCGCLHINKLINMSKKHGLSHHRLYTIYHGMINRCSNKKNRAYHNYGGRGIKVCDEWKNDFLGFYKWSMDNGYEDHLTIDRIDVNRDYSPDNCRWASYRQQGNNTRTNKRITYNGESHTLAEWSRITGISYQKLQYRTSKGWPINEVFGSPHKKNSGKSKRIKTSVYKDGALINTFDSITDAAKFCGVNEGRASRCLNGKKKQVKGYVFKRYENASK